MKNGRLAAPGVSCRGASAAFGHAAERLEHHAMSRVDGEVAHVVGGGDLDDVHADDVVLERQLTDHSQQVDGGHAAWLGCAGAGRERRVETVDVE